MAETTPSAHRKRKVAAAGLWSRIELFITFGLAAMIAGIFTFAGNVVAGRQNTYEQKCSIAQQLVLDETPSPALNAAQRARLNDRALDRIERCMGEAE